MTRLTQRGGWGLDPGCPCDVDFVDYGIAHAWRSKVLFHLGCGLHHLVGRELCRAGRDNRVVSLTSSSAELLSYAEAVMQDAWLARRYHVLLGDVYDLDADLLPQFDAVTLFHLCEPPDADRPDILLAARTVLDVFLRRLRPDGRIFFYGGSTGHAATLQVVRLAQAQGLLAPDGAHRSLLIYRPTIDRRAGATTP